MASPHCRQKPAFGGENRRPGSAPLSRLPTGPLPHCPLKATISVTPQLLNPIIDLLKLPKVGVLLLEGKGGHKCLQNRPGK